MLQIVYEDKKKAIGYEFSIQNSQWRKESVPNPNPSKDLVNIFDLKLAQLERKEIDWNTSIFIAKLPEINETGGRPLAIFLFCSVDGSELYVPVPDYYEKLRYRFETFRTNNSKDVIDLESISGCKYGLIAFKDKTLTLKPFKDMSR
jgi:hypothetical protein